jgi:hypothetical protein
MKSIERTIGWSNALLIMSAFFLLLAIPMGVDPGIAVGTPQGLIATGCVIVGGLFAAKGIREFAGILFDLDNKPWYGQRGGCIFLFVITTVINIIVPILLDSNPRLNLFAPVFTPAALFVACYATVLFWVAILDWSPGSADYKSPRKSIFHTVNNNQSQPPALYSQHPTNQSESDFQDSYPTSDHDEQASYQWRDQ